MKRYRPRPPFRFALLLGLSALAAGCSHREAEPAVMVFAAASLRDVLQEVTAEFAKTSPTPIRCNFGGSNQLAQQITSGAEADLFLSADQAWMQFVQDRHRIMAGSETALAANRLVLVAHNTSSWTISSPGDLAELPFRYLALANPRAVPAGKYAKAYLEQVPTDSESLWDRVSSRVAPAANVRFALHLVESDASIVGMVYRSDAMASKHVRILYEVPESEVSVQYFAARVQRQGGSPEAQAFFEFLTSETAGRLFEKHGFLPTAAERKMR